MSKFQFDFKRLKRPEFSYLLLVLGLFFLGGGVGFSYSRRPKPSVSILFPSPSPGERILVDVSGAVVSPGVYQLPFNSRLQLAIQAAGGLTPKADSEWVAKNLNLASKLSDGQKIYIPRKGESSTQNTSLPTDKQININTANASELDSLPGVGLKTAEKIIQNRPYQKIEDLLLKKVVNRSVFTKIKDKIRV